MCGNECKCGKEGTDYLHTCPYAEDVDGDDESVCNCCAECENACADDI